MARDGHLAAEHDIRESARHGDDDVMLGAASLLLLWTNLEGAKHQEAMTVRMELLFKHANLRVQVNGSANRSALMEENVY